MEGWIKLHRKILDCNLWISDDDEPFDRRSAWIDLLLLANHRDKQIVFDGNAMTISRGQYVTSVRKLASRWLWGKDKTLRYLRLLEELGMITKESDSKKTVINIVNYEVYQGYDSTVCDTDETVTRTQTRHRQATNKNIKNEKNKRSYATTNKFNQMIHTDYDFDEIERSILNGKDEQG